MTESRPFAIVTGASSGIGFELARLAAEHGYDLLIAADRDIESAAQRLRAGGAQVQAIEVDLASTAEVDRLCEAINNRPVDALFANAGHGLGHAFLDQDFAQARHVIDTNITGTAYLIHRIGQTMRARNSGRMLITGSIAGYIPGAFHAVYNGTKAFIDSFGLALRNELSDSGVSVTVLMPGVTDTNFFERADMQDTKVGAGPKDSAAEVAQTGFDAMMRGDADVVAGVKNKLQVALANVTPARLLAQQHRMQAEPGSAAQATNGQNLVQRHPIASVAVVMAVAAGVAALLNPQLPAKVRRRYHF